MKKNNLHDFVGLAEPCPVTRRRGMRILCDLQLSNKIPNQGRFLFSKDSNVVFFATMMRAINKLRPDWSVSVLVPQPGQVVGDGGKRYDKNAPVDVLRECLRGVGNLPNLHLLPYPYVTEAFTQRFNFNFLGLSPHLRTLVHEYDMVWCNEPAQVQNWNMTMFGRRMGDAVPVVSFCHWVTGWTARKGPSDRLDWMIRHAEGAYGSAFMLLASKMAASLFIEGARQYYNRRFLECIVPKIGTLAVPTDSGMFTEKKQLGNRSTEGPLRLLWAHRLNNYTGWKQCFDALKPLHDKRPGSFTLWVPDPGDRENQQALHESYPFIEPLDKTNWGFDDYAKLCWSSHAALGNHLFLSVWGGLAISEPQICGNVILVPDTPWYREQVGPVDSLGATYFEWHEPTAMAAAVEKLIDAPRSVVITEGEKMAAFALKSFDIDAFADRLVSFIESVAYPHRDEKWVYYIHEAAKAGHLNNDNGITLSSLYDLMHTWGKMGKLVDPDTKKSNAWPFAKKNFWACIRRRLLDSEVLVDDPSDPYCRYRVGPGVGRELPVSPEPEEQPVWRLAPSAPWLHRDTSEVVTGMKSDNDTKVHPLCSLMTEEAVDSLTLDEADFAEVCDDAAETASWQVGSTGQLETDGDSPDEERSVVEEKPKIKKKKEKIVVEEKKPEQLVVVPAANVVAPVVAPLVQQQLPPLPVADPVVIPVTTTVVVPDGTVIVPATVSTVTETAPPISTVTVPATVSTVTETVPPMIPSPVISPAPVTIRRAVTGVSEAPAEGLLAPRQAVSKSPVVREAVVRQPITDLPQEKKPDVGP